MQLLQYTVCDNLHETKSWKLETQSQCSNFEYFESDDKWRVPGLWLWPDLEDCGHSEGGQETRPVPLDGVCVCGQSEEMDLSQSSDWHCQI